MTPFLWGLAAGIVAVHLGWAIVWLSWWTLLIRHSPGKMRDEVETDFKAVRESIRRANLRLRN